MKYNYLLFCCFFWLSLYAEIPQKKGASKEKSCIVRVLIDEKIHAHCTNHSWVLSSQSGFLLYVPGKSFPKQQYKKQQISIGHKAGLLHLNDQLYQHAHVRIIPQDGFAEIDGKQFHGSFSLIKKRDKTFLINHVELEEYVCAVLKTESWPGWPIEVNKAFAVASRSYVMAIIKQQTSQLPYHVKNTNEHQTYHGMHNCSTIRAAVKQTKGLFLTHNNKPALAMFDACCGGIIPAHIDDFDFEKAPYLARSYVCTYCSRCNIYSWKKELDNATFNKQVAHLFNHPGSIEKITVTKKDKAGRVKELIVKKGNKRYTISGQQLYSALKDIKSFCYSVDKKAEKIIFSGYGFGHHIGICQWGAREMVRDGWPYKRILEFYYPGTTLAKLT